MTETPQIHQGEIVHSMNHLVVDLKTPNGGIAYFTIYDLGLMKDVGTGRVALLRVESDHGTLDRCFAETLGLGVRMQSRLRSMAKDGAAPGIGLERPPVQATIKRSPTSELGAQWTVRSADHTVTASWSEGQPAIWVSAPAPAFHPERDYHTVMISYEAAELVVDGDPVDGRPYPHPVWEERLGRPFSSCHTALSETAVTRS